MNVGTRSARERVYTRLASNVDLMALVNNRVFSPTTGASLEERLSGGPYLFYYNGTVESTNYRAYRNTVNIEIVVPAGMYEYNSEVIGNYEFLEVVLDAAFTALTPQSSGERGSIEVVGAHYIPGDGFDIWQIIVRVPITVI